MRISPITINNYNNKFCQPIKKMSFGARPTKEGLEYLAALGADMRPSLPENYFQKQGTIRDFLTQITDEKENKEMSVDKLIDTIKFYSTSSRLTDSAKAKFINEQIIGRGGSEIVNLVKTSNKLKNEDEKSAFRRALIDCYISGAAKNPFVSRNQTALYFNFISPFMSFKEETFCNYVLADSRD